MPDNNLFETNYTYTFEQRLKHLKEMFDAPYTQTEILARCIMYKLDVNITMYEEELQRNIDRIKVDSNSPLTVLNRLK